MVYHYKKQLKKQKTQSRSSISFHHIIIIIIIIKTGSDGENADPNRAHRTGVRSSLEERERKKEGSPERDTDWAWERTREANWTFKFDAFYQVGIWNLFRS